MIDLGQSALGLRGKRTYVHSTDVFAWCVRAVKATAGTRAAPRFVRSYKFLAEVHKEGRGLLFEGDDIAQASSLRPAATILFDGADDLRRLFAFVADGGDAAPTADFRSGILSVEPDGDFSGVVRCAPSSDPASFFVNLVEGNKRLHVATLARHGDGTERPFRFLFVERLPLDEVVMDAPMALHYRHVALRTSGPLAVSLNEVALDGCADQAPARISFSF